MRLIVFDLDGTLVDSHAFITRNLAETFVAEGLTPPTPEEGRNIIGLSLPEAMKRLSGGDEALIDRLVDRYRTLYHARVSDGSTEEGLYPGALEVIRALHAQPDTLLGVATGKALRGVHRILGLHGIAELFITLQTPDHNPSKPHPGMLQTAMVETGAAPAETLMIGDTTYDIEMARAAGTLALGVSWGSHPTELLLQTGAHLVIDDFAALSASIDQLFGLTHA